MGSAKENALRVKLERLYGNFNRPSWAQLDPLSVLDPTLSPEDYELWSFLVAGLSYGRVEQIKKSALDLMARLTKVGLSQNGGGLAMFLKGAELKKLQAALSGWKHRLNTDKDIFCVIEIFRLILLSHSSLARFFAATKKTEPKEHLENFCALALKQTSSLQSKKTSKKWAGTGPEWFFNSPKTGGTAKRLQMWLRWMLRADEVDPGTWTRLLSKEESLFYRSRLQVPLDTHVFKWAQSEGLLNKKSSARWPDVEELSAFFARLNPDDPLRYDFAICHQGIAKFRGLESFST